MLGTECWEQEQGGNSEASQEGIAVIQKRSLEPGGSSEDDAK